MGKKIFFSLFLIASNCFSDELISSKNTDKIVLERAWVLITMLQGREGHFNYLIPARQPAYNLYIAFCSFEMLCQNFNNGFICLAICWRRMRKNLVRAVCQLLNGFFAAAWLNFYGYCSGHGGKIVKNICIMKLISQRKQSYAYIKALHRNSLSKNLYFTRIFDNL